jgi:hypothetical protein
VRWITATVRLDPDLTELLARSLISRVSHASLELANGYAKQLRQITVARRLVREAPKPIAARRQTWKHSICGYCQGPLPRKGLKYYGRQCYPRYSVEIARPIEKAQAKLMGMRAAGLNPGHGGGSSKKTRLGSSGDNRRGITGGAPKG